MRTWFLDKYGWYADDATVLKEWKNRKKGQKNVS